jgi:hypothetical protein
MSRFEFESGTFFGGSTTIPMFVWRIVFACLVVCRCDMAGSDEDHGRNRRPGVEDRGWSSTGWVPGGWAIGRSSDAMCTMHHTQGDEKHEFLG